MAQITPGRPSATEIKFAVTMPSKITQFLIVTPSMSIEDTLNKLCESWGIQDPSLYALVDLETSFYITETNRSKLRNGSVLTLSESPRKAVQKLIGRLKGEEQREALQKLAGSALDITFVEHFIEEQGVELLLTFLESGTMQGNVLAYSLTAIFEIMEHGLVPWDTLSSDFIGQVTEHGKRSKAPSDATVTQMSLALLELAVLNSPTLYTTVANNILFDDLIPHLSRGSAIQQCSIALMNALYLGAPPERKKRFEDSLLSKDVRTAILEKVIRCQPSGGEMLHQIYVFQQLTFNILEKKLHTPIVANTQQSIDEQENIYELMKIAFGNVTDSKRSSMSAIKKLGFQDCANPVNDFMVVPPGILALNCMYYFATVHTDHYTRIVLENSCRGDAHECPFGKTGIALTNLLCSILHVGEIPDDSCHTYHPMFFACDHAFEEFFCVCIQLLNKTWRDMRATVDDLDKVISVVKEQIEYALKEKPSTMETFKTKLTALNYNEIQKRRQQERSNKEEMDSQAAPVVELRNKIRPDIIELIKQQRMKYLMQGTTVPGAKTNSQYFCRLSPNQKCVQYATVADDKNINDHEDWQSIEIKEITTLVPGADMKIKKGKLGFGIQCNEGTVEIYVPHVHALDMWWDGINAIRGRDMTSEQTKTDLKILLGMEMKLRLLDTANIDIPAESPPIPPPPTNYDFYYD